MNKTLYYILKKKITLVFLAIAFFSCQQRRNPENIKKETEEIFQKKVYKFSPFQITYKAEKIAKEITTIYQEELIDTLSSFLLNPSTQTKQLCDINSLQKTKNKAQQINASLKRIYLTQNLPSSNQNEKNIIESFLYSLENNIKVENSLVFSQSNDTIYYLHPIKIEKNTCLHCHGTQNDSKNINLIPTSQNHKKEDFIGILIISFQKKEIIKQLIKEIHSQ